MSMEWEEDGVAQAARWRSEAGVAEPSRMMVADDTLSADVAYREACEGTALLWRGDYQNARHLLDAMARRLERKPRHGSRKARGKVPEAPEAAPDPASAFHRHRQNMAQRARTLGRLLIPINADYTIPLRRAPDLRQAFEEAWGPADDQPSVVALRELLGIVGAHEWRKKGVEVNALSGVDQGSRIHPWYGVYSPLRGEYIDLVAEVALPARDLAFDIGTGTGVLAAVLARRGVQHIVGTEQDPRVLACAAENLQRLGLADRVSLVEADLWPPGQAGLVVCNPPWVPARPSAPIERAVYDEDSGMLRAFLAGLRSHLAPAGEGWLLLSDLAEHLGLRSREQLMGWIAAGGLRIAGTHSIKPRHGKARDADDPLHAARAAEITTLWRLVAAPD